MINPMLPKQAEKTIDVIITAREAHLLKVLRKYDFCKIMVHKMNGLLVRVEPTESTLLNEQDGLDI